MDYKNILIIKKKNWDKIESDTHT